MTDVRQQALAKLAERVKSSPKGEWVAVFGGWSYDQFTDSQAPFTRTMGLTV